MFYFYAVGVRCAAHSIQLAIHKAMSTYKDTQVIEHAKHIVKLLRTPNISLMLETFTSLKPTLEVNTR